MNQQQRIAAITWQQTQWSHLFDNERHKLFSDGGASVREMLNSLDFLLEGFTEARKALTDIASQHLRSEIEPDDDGEISGDFEYAYDKMIETARAALKERESE